MIWSLVRFLLFIGLIATTALVAGRLLESGSAVRMAVAGWEFTLGPLQLVVGALVLLLLFWLVLRILGLIFAALRFLNGDETAISRYFDRNRERKGYQALAEGLMAVASGEGRLALAKAASAERLLGRPDLTNLLTAQAAEAAGDSGAATTAYKRLLADDRTRFAGIRGLLRQKLAEGDTSTALKLAEHAYALKPRHVEVLDALLQLQADAGDWKGARVTLAAKQRQGHLPRDVHRRRDAVLALGEARAVLETGATVEAREAAIAANKLSPDLVPAAVLAAESYIADSQARYAARVLIKAWEAQPHPSLAAAFARIVPDETAAERLNRFDALLRLQPDHAETRLLSAELNIAAEDFPAARRALGDLPKVNPTARVLTVMAAITRGEGGDEAEVRGWLARALTAPRGPQWVCDKCHNIEDDWAPVCSNCHGFDTLTWCDPPHGGARLPHGAELLPLIVGAGPVQAFVLPPEPPPETADEPAAEPAAEAASDGHEPDSVALARGMPAQN